MKRSDILKALFQVFPSGLSHYNLASFRFESEPHHRFDLAAGDGPAACYQLPGRIVSDLEAEVCRHWQNNKGGGCCCDRKPGLRAFFTLALEEHHSVVESCRRLYSSRVGWQRSASCFSLSGAMANKSCVHLRTTVCRLLVSSLQNTIRNTATNDPLVLDLSSIWKSV